MEQGLCLVGCWTANAFLVSLTKHQELNWPDIQLFMLESGKLSNDFAKGISKNLKVPELTTMQFYAGNEGKDAFFLAILLARPKQRGEVTLASSNPKDYPLLNPKYLSEPEDVRSLIEGAHRAVNLVENTRAFQKLKARFSPTPFPGCETLQFRSDAYWECFYRQFTVAGLRLAGSCPMGGINSNEAVVDSQLHVLGTKGLRVIDASIMPRITTGNTNAATMMIGEMGSGLIKSYWTSVKSHF